MQKLLPIVYLSMNPFYEIMREHPDAKLLDIVEKKRHEYQPEAVAAAEKVLIERRIAWKKNDDEELTEEDLLEEVSARLAAGQSMHTIKAQLKSKKLNGFELAERDQQELEKNDPALAAKRRRTTAILTGMAVIILGCFKFVSAAPGPLIVVALTTLIVGLILITFPPKK